MNDGQAMELLPVPPGYTRFMIFTSGGLSFLVASSNDLASFTKGARADGFVLTEEQYIPYPSIVAIIRHGSSQVQANAAGVGTFQ